MTEEHKRKISESHMGSKNPMFGKRFSKKHKEKISVALKGKNTWSKGRKLTDEHIEKIRQSLKGKMPKNIELVKKIGEKFRFKKGYKHTQEWKDEVSKKLKGRESPVKGKHWHLSLDVIKKLSEARKGKNNPVWKGGVSFEPYSTDWTKTLKRSIRERDGYICRVCGKKPSTSVHHTDYNKKNCNPDNLITLCLSCHGKTNENRKYWVEFFRELQIH